LQPFYTSKTKKMDFEKQTITIRNNSVYLLEYSNLTIVPARRVCSYIIKTKPSNIDNGLINQQKIIVGLSFTNASYLTHRMSAR